ncbi:MAG: hypothetical protein ACI8Z5_000372 [Lentimonas sp.]|jgi:hypothetical protein
MILDLVELLQATTPLLTNTSWMFALVIFAAQID